MGPQDTRCSCCCCKGQCGPQLAREGAVTIYLIPITPLVPLVVPDAVRPPVPMIAPVTMLEAAACKETRIEDPQPQDDGHLWEPQMLRPEILQPVEMFESEMKQLETLQKETHQLEVLQSVDLLQPEGLRLWEVEPERMQQPVDLLRTEKQADYLLPEHLLEEVLYDFLPEDLRQNGGFLPMQQVPIQQQPPPQQRKRKRNHISTSAPHAKRFRPSKRSDHPRDGHQPGRTGGPLRPQGSAASVPPAASARPVLAARGAEARARQKVAEARRQAGKPVEEVWTPRKRKLDRDASILTENRPRVAGAMKARVPGAASVEAQRLGYHVGGWLGVEVSRHNYSRGPTVRKKSHHCGMYV